jgi:ribosomal protein S18 acetylase RimI-like enzyme
MAITIAPAADDTFDTLVLAFNEGYEGYIVPVHLDEAQLRGHFDHHNIDLGASRLAYDDGQVVGVALLGIRGRRGWVGGVGVNAAYRGQGVGRGLMNALLDSAREGGLETVQLEVIQGNEAAHKLYLSLGFKDSRRLLIVERQPVAGGEASDLSIQSVPAADALAYAAEFHAVANPWQREPESLQPLAARMNGWLAVRDEWVTAYAVGHSGERAVQWMDMGCAAGETNALRELIEGVHAQYPGAVGHFVNIGEDEPVWPVLANLGYVETLAQFEMGMWL